MRREKRHPVTRALDCSKEEGRREDAGGGGGGEPGDRGDRGDRGELVRPSAGFRPIAWNFLALNGADSAPATTVLGQPAAKQRTRIFDWWSCLSSSPPVSRPLLGHCPTPPPNQFPLQLGFVRFLPIISIHPSIHPLIHRSIHRSIDSSIDRSIYTSIHFSFLISFFRPVCLS